MVEGLNPSLGNHPSVSVTRCQASLFQEFPSLQCNCNAFQEFPSLNQITTEKRGRVMDTMRALSFKSRFKENHFSFYSWQDWRTSQMRRRNDFMRREKDFEHLDLQMLRICSGTGKGDCGSKSGQTVAFQPNVNYSAQISYWILWQYQILILLRSHNSEVI